ncbi:MAG: 2-oxo acid dehydrogenase subunit E2 [Bacteroidota bacterium]|nr:2-oxo acid dehydrogenase subunit E2 [Bacteroidota bacterium]
MAEILRMPKLSDTMTEGIIAKWHKKVGDSVKSGELLADVDSDKATMEVESYETGTILYLGAKEKEAVLVDGVIAIVGKPGESIADLLSGLNGSTQKSAETVAPKAETVVAPAKADTSNIKANIIRMPKMSDTMTEGTIEKWHKKVGDKVKSGELLADVTTDKATMELESYESGTLLYIGVEEGKAVIVDGILAIVGEPYADYKALLNEPVATVKVEAAPTSPTPSSAPVVQSHSAANEGDRVLASPLAKKLAADKGIDIRLVKGSADGGRIVKKDIESFVPGAAKSADLSVKSNATATVGLESFEEVPVSSMRKVIAKRLGESLFTAPHFSLTMEINMNKAVEARKSLNEWAEAKISFNDMVIKAVAHAIRKNPKVNGSWLGDKIRYNHHIHIGVAVAVEEGLLVPVVRFADNKSLTQISAEVKELGGKAKAGKLQPNDWAGNTFTISNLGMFGIEEFTSIINQPDACILSVGAIKQVPVVKDGGFVVGNIMKVTLSCDHRVVDGAVGSQFLVTLKGLLEDPIRMMA